MKDSILIKSIIFNCVISALLLYAAVSFFKGINAFNNKSIIIQNVIMKILITNILPIIFIMAGVWFSGGPILDYTIKDYRTNKGILRNINVPYRYIVTDEFFMEGEKEPYYLPKGLLKSEEKGKMYEFRYGKRSHIILEIREFNQ